MLGVRGPRSSVERVRGGEASREVATSKRGTRGFEFPQRKVRRARRARAFERRERATTPSDRPSRRERANASLTSPVSRHRADQPRRVVFSDDSLFAVKSALSDANGSGKMTASRRDTDRGSLLQSTMGSPQHRYPLRHKRKGKDAGAEDGASDLHPARGTPPVARSVARKTPSRFLVCEGEPFVPLPRFRFFAEKKNRGAPRRTPRGAHRERATDAKKKKGA